jgi:hypothetical protein
LIVWVVCVVVSTFIATTLAVAWSVRHAIAMGRHFSPAQRQFVLAIADFPILARDSLAEVSVLFRRSPALLADRSRVEEPYWVRRFPAPEDPGFLLYSGADPVTTNNVVKLIRVSDGKIVAQWNPDWSAIYARTTDKAFRKKGSIYNMQALNPLPLPGGDIVFNTAFAMTRVTRCSGQPVWVLDELVHHSNVLDDEGTIWTGGISTDGFSDNQFLRDRVRDDAILRVSQDGKVLERHSIVKILRDNGLEALLMGTNGETLPIDPLHLNQVRKAERDTQYWRRGDLLVSMRHLSMVLIYRPSTGKIVWHQVGPWMNQHDADFIDDHRISVFDNNVYSGAPDTQPFIVKGDVNRVFIYDFANGQLAQPWAKLLAEARPVTIHEGRARVLPDGGLFVEESNQGRILRFTADRLLWSYINDYDSTHVAVAAWSRYMTPEEAAPLIKDVAGKECPAK